MVRVGLVGFALSSIVAIAVIVYCLFTSEKSNTVPIRQTDPTDRSCKIESIDAVRCAESKWSDISEIIPNLYLGSILSPELAMMKLRTDSTSSGPSDPSGSSSSAGKKLRIVNARAEGHDSELIRMSPRVVYKHISIDDVKTANLAQHFDETNAFIDDGISNGDLVLVHCHAGISRSVTLVIAYLMWKYKIGVDEAIAFVKSKRSVIRPNDGFRKQLEIYSRSINPSE